MVLELSFGVDEDCGRSCGIVWDWLLGVRCRFVPAHLLVLECGHRQRGVQVIVLKVRLEEEKSSGLLRVVHWSTSWVRGLSM